MELTDYSQYIVQSRYARYLDDQHRRETWEEIVDRYCDFWIERIKKMDLSDEVKKELLEVWG